MKLVSGTRESELAMMQTTYVNKLLTEANPDLEIDVLSMTTKGIVFIKFTPKFSSQIFIRCHTFSYEQRR